MLTLATALVSALAASGSDTPDTPDPHVVLAIAATDVQVRLPLEGWRDDPARLELMRKTDGEHLLAAGFLGSDAVRVTIYGGPVPTTDGAKVREAALGDRLLGMGLSTIAGYASAKTIRELKSPYRDVVRHVFMIGAGALAHVQTIALEGEDPEKLSDARFEQIATDARFAVVRRTLWDDLPARYLELSHAAAIREDGAAWLGRLAIEDGADWIVKLAAFEHAVSARSTDERVLELGGDIRAQLIAREKRTREEDVGLLLAEDGLGLTLLRANDIQGSADHIAIARDLASRFDPSVTARTRLSEACLQAQRKDPDAVVALLEAAYAVVPVLRYSMQREPLLAPVHEDPRVKKLLEVKLQPKSNRSLGR